MASEKRRLNPRNVTDHLLALRKSIITTELRINPKLREDGRSQEEHIKQDLQFQFLQMNTENHNYIFVVCKSRYNHLKEAFYVQLMRKWNQYFDFELKIPDDFIIKNRMGGTFLKKGDFVGRFRGFDLLPEKEGIDPNYSVGYWEVFGKPCTLRAYRDKDLVNVYMATQLKNGDVSTSLHLPHLEKLYALHGLNADLESEDHYEWKSWKEYCSDYEKIYGEKPLMENLKKFTFSTERKKENKNVE